MARAIQEGEVPIQVFALEKKKKHVDCNYIFSKIKNRVWKRIFTISFKTGVVRDLK